MCSASFAFVNCFSAIMCIVAQRLNGCKLKIVPVTEKTLTMKIGDLMIEYHLLPAIAVQAWERLHEK